MIGSDEQPARIAIVGGGVAALEAMLALAIVELIPQAAREGLRLAGLGLLSGVLVMVALDSLLHV